MTAPKLTEAQRAERRVLADFKRNLSPELYAAVIRLRRARAKAIRNFYNETVWVNSNDLIALLDEFERVYSPNANRPATDAGRAALRGDQ